MVRRFERASLKNKLMLSMLVGILLISATIAFIARWILVSSLTNELEQRGAAIAHSVAERGGSCILDNDIPRLLSLIFDERRLHERKKLVSYIVIEDQHGKVLAHTMTRRLPPAVLAHELPQDLRQSIQLVDLDGEAVYDIAAGINEGLYRIGTVHVGLNKSHIDSLVSKLRVAFLGFISGVVVIAFFLSNRLSRNITKPIRDLTAIADEISRGNFDIPIEASAPDDGWDFSDCPAYPNSDLPCWHFDLSHTERPDRMPEEYRNCRRCVFYSKREGDEVTQLADSFRNMVWSIRLYRHRLRESEEKYRSLFDSGPDPIFVVDCESGRVMDANPRVEELYGYSRDELRLMSYTSLAPENYQECLDHFDDGGGCIYFPKAIHYKRGQAPFFVNMHACPISYRGRHAIIVAVTDITEMIEKDAQLIQAGKMKSLGEMSAGIAHELNQPLNAIKMGSEYLMMVEETGQDIPARQRLEVVAEISAQVDRASGIINTLRSFGRQADLVTEKVDINGPVRAVLSLLRRQFELDNIRFRLDLPEGLPAIKAHGNRLQQVVFNLVTNARDAINDGSDPGDKAGERVIFIRTQASGGSVRLEVGDTGPGMTEEVRGKVFEPFFTTKEAGQGMGLGLAISYGIVKDYGGEVQIESEPGAGTVFRLVFPAA
ncbi:ATP-binding protein [Salidesulfovibrio onnuriiensis]|uniref:ATP-binding protein n=1 Tax=Salidesulfovibrio onnuriiensis TaxID=2583823 RepID=UPI0011C9824D|nr:ATP-binding protein [Salidesulfovibrio onnuriiensis]